MTKRGINILLIFSGLVLAGCAAHEDTYYRNIAAIESLRAPPSLKGAHRFKGVTIKFPNTGEWRVLSEKEEFFTASKKLAVPLYTSALVVAIVHPPKTYYLSDQEFYIEAQQSVIHDRHQEINRLALKTEAGVGQWKSCLKYYKRFTTIDEKYAPRRRLFQEELGYLCQHPYTRGVFFRIDYSERYPDDIDIVQFAERGGQFLENVSFDEN